MKQRYIIEIDLTVEGHSSYTFAKISEPADSPDQASRQVLSSLVNGKPDWMSDFEVLDKQVSLRAVFIEPARPHEVDVLIDRL